MNARNTNIEKILRFRGFTGIPDFVAIHSVQEDQFTRIEDENAIIYVRQFESFFRYSFKQK